MTRILQMLVQNHLENEYPLDSIYIYDTISKDVGEFEKVIKELKRNEDHYEFVEEDDHITTHAFVYSEEACTISHLLQLISELEFPQNTRAELIFILESEEKHISKFNEYKDALLSLSDEAKYNIFNSLINEAFLSRTFVNDALCDIVNLSKENKIGLYRYNITWEYYETILNNFKRIQVKVMRIEDLLTYPLTKEFVLQYLR